MRGGKLAGQREPDERADDETATAALLAVGGQGNIRTTTLRGFSADEMKGVIARAG